MLKSGISKKHSQIYCRCFIMKIFTRLQSELMHIWPPKTWSIFNLVVFNLIWCFLTCSRLKFTSSWNTQVMIFNMNILKVTSWTTFSHRCWREFFFPQSSSDVCSHSSNNLSDLCEGNRMLQPSIYQPQLRCLGPGSILPEKLLRPKESSRQNMTRSFISDQDGERMSAQVFVCMIQLEIAHLLSV